MDEKIRLMEESAQADLDAVASDDDLGKYRSRWLGKKGEITGLMKGMKDLSPEDRPAFGAKINAFKDRIESAVETRRTAFEVQERLKRIRAEAVDVSLPGRAPARGRLSPLTLVLREATRVFESMGFAVKDGPEIETEYYNFDALNFPSDHPARDMQDTLFVRDGVVLRTHTSPVQVRTMLRQQPPVRMICPGWVYRSDTLDASHSPMFSQVEGLLVDRGVSFGDLFGVLNEFVTRFFGPSMKTRYRPSFFPFTEPSAEMDVTCIICNGTGHLHDAPCRVCKGTGWKEILGCGMVDPNVFANVGYDPEIYTGFAFGMGIERLAMFKFGVDEIRHFFEGDLRFITQF